MRAEHTVNFEEVKEKNFSEMQLLISLGTGSYWIEKHQVLSFSEKKVVWLDALGLRKDLCRHFSKDESMGTCVCFVMGNQSYQLYPLWRVVQSLLDFPDGSASKESTRNAGGTSRHRFDPWGNKISCRRKYQPIPVFSPGKSYGQSSLAGYSPRGCKESDMTEQLSTKHQSL